MCSQRAKDCGLNAMPPPQRGGQHERDHDGQDDSENQRMPVIVQRVHGAASLPEVVVFTGLGGAFRGFEE